MSACLEVREDRAYVLALNHIGAYIYNVLYILKKSAVNTGINKPLTGEITLVFPFFQSMFNHLHYIVKEILQCYTSFRFRQKTEPLLTLNV